MKDLTIDEKLQLIIDLAKKYDITAYEISNNTELNQSSLQKLLKGDVKNPRITTVDIVLNYIESTVKDKKEPKHYNVSDALKIVSEPAAPYNIELEVLRNENSHLKKMLELQKEMIDILKNHNKENIKPE